MKNRAIVIVIDSMGIGAMDDAPKYGDSLKCNTLCNLAKANGGINVPTLEALGLGNIRTIKGVSKTKTPKGQYGVMKMKSKGKDTTTGHWELMGLVLDKPFKTYKKFPDELISKLIERTDCKNILGNKPASGTKIIEEYNAVHTRSKFPIIYTSADSVFQIAVNIDVVKLETLYSWCTIARELLDEGGYRVSRVIARPYKVTNGVPTRIGKYRHDYSIKPPQDTLLNVIEQSGKAVYGIGKINDIFVGSGITKFTPTGSNIEGLDITLDAIRNDASDLIFTNLVDTDMLYGHRRDYKGYARAIETIDKYLVNIINAMKDDDLLIVTADHGCDPTFEGTDHTREMVPVILYHKGIAPGNIGIHDSFTYVTQRIKDWLFHK